MFLRQIKRLVLYSRRAVLRCDERLRLALDRVLPRNLTIRYTVALATVAAIAMSGQMVIQYSLQRQLEMGRKIRHVATLIFLSERLRKTVLEVRLSSRRIDTDELVQSAQTLARQIEAGHRQLRIHSTLALDALSETAAQLSLVKGEYQLSEVAKALLANEAEYRRLMEFLATQYEQDLLKDISDFKNIELLLFFLTLLVLALEGLYVFRPAAESLYAALRARSDFLSRMSHEVRNPLNSIMGMSNLLSETPLNDQQKKYLSIMRTSGAALLDVLNNLLDFSSIESGKLKLEMKRFNLYELLERSLDFVVYGAHANRIDLIFDVDSDVPTEVEGDPTRLQQVLLNLLSNAVKFTKQGSVTLKVSVADDQPFDESNSVAIVFSVVDTGMGMGQAQMSRIFDPFMQADSSIRRKYGGTGLGLSISRELVKLMGGSLSVASEKNRGSEFWFSIPLRVNAETQRIADAARAHSLDGVRVFVQDHDQKTVEVVRRLVTQAGGQAIVVQDIGDLRAAALRPGLQRSILVSSEELVREMTETEAWAKVLLSSSVVLVRTVISTSEVDRLSRRGVRNLLFKPVKPIAFYQALSVVLRAQPLASTKADDFIEDTRPLRILVADDSKENQFLVQAYLETTPYSLTFAANGLEAVDKFENNRFDAVLMDLQMPEMDGHSAALVIREYERSRGGRRTPIVAVSAHEPIKVLAKVEPGLFQASLVKPVSPIDLRRTIVEVTQERAVEEKPDTQSTIIARVQERIASLAPTYLKNREVELVDLRQWIEDRDFKKIKVVGHRLKGNAVSYGFPELSRIGALLEEAARDERLMETRELIDLIAKFLEARKARPSPEL